MKLKKIWKQVGIFMTDDYAFYFVKNFHGRKIMIPYQPRVENQYLKVYCIKEQVSGEFDYKHTYLILRKEVDGSLALIYEFSTYNYFEPTLLGKDVIFNIYYSSNGGFVYDFKYVKFFSSEIQTEISHQIPVNLIVGEERLVFERGALKLSLKDGSVQYYKNVNNVFIRVAEAELDKRLDPPYGWSYVSEVFDEEIEEKL